MLLSKEIYNIAAPKYTTRSVARLFEGGCKLGRRAVSGVSQVLFQHLITSRKKSLKLSYSFWGRRLKLNDNRFFQTLRRANASTYKHLKI